MRRSFLLFACFSLSLSLSHTRTHACPHNHSRTDTHSLSLCSYRASLRITVCGFAERSSIFSSSFMLPPCFSHTHCVVFTPYTFVPLSACSFFRSLVVSLSLPLPLPLPFLPTCLLLSKGEALRVAFFRFVLSFFVFVVLLSVCVLSLSPPPPVLQATTVREANLSLPSPLPTILCGVLCLLARLVPFSLPLSPVPSLSLPLLSLSCACTTTVLLGSQTHVSTL